MTYPYGVKGLPVVGHGLPGLPQRQPRSGYGGVVVAIGGGSGVPYGKQVPRADFPSLSAVLPPTMLSQAYGCQVITPEVDVSRQYQLSVSKDGAYVFGRNLRKIENDVVAFVSGTAVAAIGATSIDDLAETFAYTTSGGVGILDRSGNTVVSSQPVTGVNGVLGVSLKGNGLEMALGVSYSTLPSIRTFYRSSKASTSWTQRDQLEAAGNVFAVAYSPSGEYLAALGAGAAPNGLSLWRSSEAGNLTKVFNLPENLSSKARLAWSPDGGHLAVITIGSLRVYEILGDTLNLVRLVSHGAQLALGVSWQNDRTVILLADGAVISGQTYTGRVCAYDIVLDNLITLDKYIFTYNAESNLENGSISACANRVVIYRSNVLDIRGSDLQLIASVTQPDTLVG